MTALEAARHVMDKPNLLYEARRAVREYLTMEAEHLDPCEAVNVWLATSFSEKDRAAEDLLEEVRA